MRKPPPMLVALATVIMWGVNFTVLKSALARFDVLTFGWLRFAGMLTLAWLVAALRGEARLPPRPERGRVVAAGLLGYPGYILLALLGLSFTSAFSNALLIAAAPVFSALLLRALRAESIGPARAAGLALSLGGVAVFMGRELGAGWSRAGLGDLVSLAAAAMFAAYTVSVKPLAARHPATSVTAWTLTAGAVPVLLATAPALARQDWSRLDAGAWLVLAWSMTVPVYVAWTAWSWAGARAGVAATNALLVLVPVASGVTSALAGREAFGPLVLGGGALVVAGLLLGRRRRPGDQSIATPPFTSRVTPVR